MNISDIIHIDQNTFYYQQNNNPDLRLYFQKDLTMDFNSARISTISHPDYLTNYVIYYNIPEYAKIVSFPEQLSSIYRSYILKNSFAHPHNNTIGSWAVYDDSSSSYFLNFNYIFNIEKDYNSFPTCRYLTCSSNILNSKEYQYANKSKGTICSHPKMIENSSGKVSYCTMIFNHPVECFMYQRDSEEIIKYSLTSKYSSQTYTFAALLSRFIDHLLISVQNDSNQSVLTVKLFNLDNISKQDIYLEAEKLMQEVLSGYSSEYYDITKEEPSSVFVQSPKKKSYISTLV